MRIAHFSVGPWGHRSTNGVSQSIYFLCRAEAAAGADVAIFGMSRSAVEKPDGVESYVFPKGRRGPSLNPQMSQHLRAWNPDLVHMHSVYVPENVLLARTLRQWGVPYVITPHGGLSRVVERRNRWKKYIYKHFIERPFDNRAVFVHAIADAEDIRAYGVDSPIVSAPNGIDLELIPTAHDPEIVVRRFPNLRDRKLFVFLGRLDPFHKGIDLLLKAFHEVRTLIPDFAILLVGPDWHNRARGIVQLREELDLHRDVYLWGPVHGDDKYSILRCSTAFVHPSRWEAGVPFSVLEALACERPSLVTAGADPQRLIAEWGAGLVVEPEVEEIRDGLVRLARSSDSEASAMGRRGRQLVSERFNWGETARSLLSAYERYTS